MMSMPNIIIVIAMPMMVAPLTLVSNAYLARIQEPPPWAAAIKQAVKGFISGIFTWILQCFDDLVDPPCLEDDVIGQRVSRDPVPLGECAESDDTQAQQYPQ